MERPLVETTRFLVTIVEAAFRERGKPDPVWSVGERRDLGSEAERFMPTERAHRYLVATGRGLQKAVAIAVEEFHRPERNGCPARSLLSVHAEPFPGPVDEHTLLDVHDQ